MNITPEILKAFEPYKNGNSVCIPNIGSIYDAYRKLTEMGLEISNKIIVNEVINPYMSFNYNMEYGRHRITSSYDIIENEDATIKNNIATYLPMLNCLLVHYNYSNATLGRKHGIKIDRWMTI